MTKVCRLCLCRLQRGSKYFNVNAVESFTGFMPYRDQLTTCIPEMALDLIPNPVICNNCRTALKFSYDFKARCLMIEKKIREYVENHSPESGVFNLGDIDTTSLPKFAKVLEVESSKVAPLIPKEEPAQDDETPPNSILSNLLSVTKEVILPNFSEIEVTNVKFRPIAPKRASKAAAIEEPLQPPIERDEDGLLACNHCDIKFTNVPSLHTHKSRVHEEEYLCNFCNVPFKSLQNLRKHNQQCQKVRSGPQAASMSNVLTKRPHLPAKAKNHLKRWLFNHTEHPYPTDVEKQQLMKETNLSLLQVENWFINARRRILADLTKLKNLKGKIVRKGRKRTFMEDPEEIFEEDPESLLDQAKSQSRSATKLLRDLDELEVKPNEEEEEEEDEENGDLRYDKMEMDEMDITEHPVDAIVEEDNPEEETQPNSEEGSFDEEVPLNTLKTVIKTEIDVDER